MLNRRRTSELRCLALEQRPVALYTGGCLSNPSLSRSAVSLLRHLGGRVLAVVDDRSAGSVVASIQGLSSFGAVPIVLHPRDLGDPDVDLIVAMDLPPSKRLIARHRTELLDAAESGRRVWNGLHETITHPNVRNLRAADPSRHDGRSHSPLQSTRIICLGTSAAAPPLEVVLALVRRLSADGHTVDCLPTSPAGVLLRGYGRCIDGATSHAAPFIVEQLVMGLEASVAVVVVEGAGSVLDPSDLSTIAAVAAGAQSGFYVLCHRVAPDTDVAAELLDAADRVDAIHRAAGARSRLLAVSLDTSELASRDEHCAVEAARSLGVPVAVVATAGNALDPIDASSIAVAFDALHMGVSS